MADGSLYVGTGDNIPFDDYFRNYYFEKGNKYWVDLHKIQELFVS
jgi:hypothetical protein